MKTVALDFRLAISDGAYSVRLQSEGHPSAEEPFSVDLKPGSRLAKVVAKIEAGQASIEDLADIGSQLWASVRPGEVGSLFERIASAEEDGDTRFLVRLAVPSELQALPWETFYDEGQRAFLASHPRYATVRQPPEGISPPRLPDRRPGPLSVLVAIPDGSGLQTAREWKNLEYATEKIGDRIQLERLDGLVTPDRLAEKLGERPWDVFHFVGHGRLEKNGDVKVRVNDDTVSDQALWLGAETFANVFIDSHVRLAVLNCCLGAHQDESRSLSGLGPYLVRAGVPSVVAMRYEIEDDDAIRFSRTFYHELLAGAVPGSVEFAVEKARQAMYLRHRPETARAFVTPVLCMVPGSRLPTNFGEQEVPEQEPEGDAPQEPGINVPAELVAALKDGRLVPIVGPELIHAGVDTTRSIDAERPPTAIELARHLSERHEYPDHCDFEMTEVAGEWAGWLLLQRVFQYYLFQEAGSAFRLVEALREAYSQVAPAPAVKALSRWTTPGIYYAHIDGILADALEGRNFRVLNRVDQPGAAKDGAPILVHLRGTVTDADSLVLTEDDHERLWDRMANLCPDVADLALEGLGRSLLFVGVSPRDTVVRRLMNRLFPRGPSRNQGPIFFVWPGHTDVDEAYWNRFKVSWIDEKPETVVAALTGALDA